MSGGFPPQECERGWARASIANDNNGDSQKRGTLMPAHDAQAGRIRQGRSTAGFLRKISSKELLFL